LHSWA